MSAALALVSVMLMPHATILWVDSSVRAIMVSVEMEKLASKKARRRNCWLNNRFLQLSSHFPPILSLESLTSCREGSVNCACEGEGSRQSCYCNPGFNIMSGNGTCQGKKKKKQFCGILD